MAKIWPVYEGQRPTFGEPWARLPLGEAIAIFDLQPEDFVSGLDATPRFGPHDRDLTYQGFKHVVVEVERREGQRARWKPGFYRSRIKPKEAFGRLIRQAVTAEMGKDNVVRLAWEPTTDSQNREALKIVVVITPGATQRLERGGVLDVLVSVQKRLHEMGDQRIPVIEYVTEAELERDGGP